MFFKQKCKDCGAYIDKINPVLFQGIFYEFKGYFCGKCKKPFTRVFDGGGRTRYFAEVEVDETGKPIKKICKPQKQ